MEERRTFRPMDLCPMRLRQYGLLSPFLVPIYGEEKVLSERPFRASLSGGVWTIEGTLPAGRSAGGVALVKLAKRDARVIQVIHGK
jgi:hypothetical protein